MIVIGYQGIGKTTLAKDDYRFIDLDSHIFKRFPGDWVTIYCTVAEVLSSQGYTVFVSAHEHVQDALFGSTELVYFCYPCLELQKEWLDRLNQRQKESGLSKDWHAYNRAAAYYKDDIKKMMENGADRSIVITSMDYNLKRAIVDRIEYENNKAALAE